MRYKINVFLNNIKSAVFSTGGKCPFGLVPILEVEGVTLCESMAILRFVAKRHGKYFSDLFRSRSLGCHAIRPLLEGALRDIHMNANVRDIAPTHRILPDPVHIRPNEFENATYFLILHLRQIYA